MKELDRVELLEAIEGVPKGSIVTIIHSYELMGAYEVEFNNEVYLVFENQIKSV